MSSLTAEVLLTVEVLGRPTAEPHSDATADQDRSFMSAALAHSRQALGTTAPNPSVGALVVRDGQIVGRGVTARGGRPHAEVVALAQAGATARGATLYVTLEPCAERSDPRFGPSCTDAGIAAGIARVVVAADDPSPMAHGGCYDRLAAAGISVTRGVCADEARRLHRGHVNRVVLARPMVTLKLAETSDGFAAAAPGAPRLLITGAPANRCVHVMRAHHDAIMVGIGTVRADDPVLTVRLDTLPVRRPARIVLDADLSLPLRSRLVRTVASAPVWAVGATDAPLERETALRSAGITVLRTRRSSDGRLDLRDVLEALADQGLSRVFSEGGPTVGAALLSGDLVDEAAIFTSPDPSGNEGLAALAPADRARLGDAAVFRRAANVYVGKDRLVHYERIS